MKSVNSSVFEKLVIPALSFFNEQGKIDFESTGYYIDFLNKSPVRRIILFGTTGEGVSLGVSEKRDLLCFYKEFLAEHIEVTVCTGSWCIKDIEIVVKDVSRVHSILQLPTMYYNRDDPRLIRFYSSLSQAIPHDIYLYHLPKNTLFSFTPQDVLAYRESHATIRGIKLSHASLVEIATFALLERFEVWHGSDKNIKLALDAGASCVVCQNLAAGIKALHERDDLNDIQRVANHIRERIESSKRGEKIGMLKASLSEICGVSFPAFVRAPNF